MAANRQDKLEKKMQRTATFWCMWLLRLAYLFGGNAQPTKHTIHEREMFLKPNFHTHRNASLCGIYMTQSSGDGKSNLPNRPEKPPAEEFAPLAANFNRRLLVGAGSASLVAVGANFGGITSFVLGFWPEIGRNLKLDVLYSIGGFSRYIDTDKGFEFMYPETWVGDQTLLYRAAEKAESQTSLDPPPIGKPRRKISNEPTVAFGPPGSTGELNLSVIVSPVPKSFSIEAFGGPKEVGEAIVRTITGGSGRQTDVKGTLLRSNIREDSVRNIKYYEIEFEVKSSLFERHNVSVCCARDGRLYTLNAQTPESEWPLVMSQFHMISNSFNLVS